MDNITAPSTITSCCYISGYTGCIFNLKAALEALSDPLIKQYALEVLSSKPEAKNPFPRALTDNSMVSCPITSYCHSSACTGCICNLKAVLEALSDTLSKQYAVEVLSSNAEAKSQYSRV